MSTKLHIEELSKITTALSKTQENLELAGNLINQIEKRVTSIEARVGIKN